MLEVMLWACVACAVDMCAISSSSWSHAYKGIYCYIMQVNTSIVIEMLYMYWLQALAERRLLAELKVFMSDEPAPQPAPEAVTSSEAVQAPT
jgi:hypothetical protein